MTTGDAALALVLLIPAVAAVLLAALPAARAATQLNVLASAASLLAVVALIAERPAPGPFLVVDELNLVFLAVGALVTLTTSIFSGGYVLHELATGRLSGRTVRFYHAVYQTMAAAMALALLANNIGLMWVAVEIATLSTVLMVGLYRTEAALEAAWKYFILASVGIALAFFGTILVYLAAQTAMGEGLAAMAWTELRPRAAGFDPALMNLAFVFLMIGYGTKMGLVPLHAWLPDAHAEGPTPICAVLSGLLLNVALLAVLRFKTLMTANPAAIDPGPVLMAMGLVSVLFATLLLYRRRDIKRLFAFSSIEHIGICAFAFGLGGAVASTAGLLHMAMHSLTKSAIFFAIGAMAQARGTQRLDGLRGLGETQPLVAFGFAAAVAAIAGLPPFGLFASEFMLLTTGFATAPLAAAGLSLGLLIGIGALVLRLQDVVLGDPGEAVRVPERAGVLVPMAVNLGVVLIAGIWLPGPIAVWLQKVAAWLG